MFISWLGYVYAFVACLESIVPLVATVSFDSLYKATVDLFPATVFLVEMGIEIILTTAFVYVFFSLICLVRSNFS